MVASPKFRPWWILLVRVCPWHVHAPKCPNYALTNLLFGLCRSVWVIELLVNLPSPHPRAQSCPSSLEVLWAKECSLTLPFFVFTFGFTVESIKELGSASIMFKDLLNLWIFYVFFGSLLSFCILFFNENIKSVWFIFTNNTFIMKMKVAWLVGVVCLFVSWNCFINVWGKPYQVCQKNTIDSGKLSNCLNIDVLLNIVRNPLRTCLALRLCFQVHHT